ncbi:MAG: gliding motility-associated C-terminal domain-containing protein [Bacteroidia bacterium]
MRIPAYLILICLWLLPAVTLATHNRAGEITYRHLGGFQYEATIITYTKSDSPADRPDLGISWGDGTLDTIPRVNGNGQGEIVTGLIKKNIYIGVHTFPGPAVYILSFEDPNRNGGVVNIPNSVNIPFFVSTTLVINPFLGINNSVQLLNPPIDEACPGQIFIHNPGAYDPDGDSISYRLTECRGEEGLVIPGFAQPQTSTSFSINPITGDLIWDSPLPGGLGEYNVAFVIEEWRNGILIGSVTRDMQINVVPCTNEPPEIEDLQDLCIDAGSDLQFQVQASNPDNTPPQSITLSATGGPFLFPEPGMASFPAVTSSSGVVTQTFNWLTDCSHVRKAAYAISFKAIDNGNPPLATYRSMNITVVAPAPENLLAEAVSGGVQLSWDLSPCNQAAGYKIYRRSGSFPFDPGPCETGVPAYTGYELVATLNSVSENSWFDNAAVLTPGNTYCYRVIAWFTDGAESYSSNESCASMPEVVPVITHVSIEATSVNTGEVFVAWSKPDDLDTDVFPGPYRYSVERRDASGGAFNAIGEALGINDTTFTDNSPGLNTVSGGSSYRIVLYSGTAGEVETGSSVVAGSVFLQASAADNSVSLSWNADVPWNNTEYRIFRKAPGETEFTELSTTTEVTFKDSGLANGSEFCYYVESSGAYSSPGYENPLLNKSQEVCAVPADLTPPCKPLALINVNCDSLFSRLSWTAVPAGCDEDVVKVKVFFRPAQAEEFILLNEFNYPADSIMLHEPGESLAGCYRIIAVDSFMNESAYTELCADNCPVYELPNTFSPNGDGVNDFFRPFPYAFIESVEFSVYNRWGNLLYETTDAMIKWDGTWQGQLLPDGVYYYICTVNEIRLEGIVKRKLKGTIQLFGISSKSGN